VDLTLDAGNFPESCELHALNTDEVVPSATDDAWTLILPRTKLGPHKQHHFQLSNVSEHVFSHVRMAIHPDGGVKRLRITGTRATDNVVGAHVAVASASVEAPSIATVDTTAPSTAPNTSTEVDKQGPTLPVLPLTAEAFAPFGQVVQAYSDPNGAPRGVKVTIANQGTASKFHKLSLPTSSYPEGNDATLGLSVFRCGPIEAKAGEKWEIKRLERHPYTNQGFVPMGGSRKDAVDALEQPGDAYLVIVAKGGDDAQPDLTTMRAFLANGGQGIVYDTGIWRTSNVSYDLEQRAEPFTYLQIIRWQFLDG
jgi:allantoicase